MASIVLDGPWFAKASNPEDRSAFIFSDADMDSWLPVHVPGHWSQNEQFCGEESLLYRTIYESEDHVDTTNRRHWLCLGGVWHGADIWFDGIYLGPTDTWFAPDHFEITGLIRPGSRHVVAVEVHAPASRVGGFQQDLGGIFGMESIVGDVEPGGFLAPVRIVSTGTVKFSKQTALCLNANTETATVALRAQVDSSITQSAVITTTLFPPNGAPPLATRRQYGLKAGPAEIEWHAMISNPQLWWPYELGKQPLYRLNVTVEVDGQISDIWEKRIGLREIEMSDLTLRVNGRKLFIRGVNRWPCEPVPVITDGYANARMAPAARCHPSESDRDVIDPKADLSLVKDLGLNLIRIESHIASPEVYSAADQLGLLIWQDFPVAGKFHPAVVEDALDSVARLVEQLGSFPSVALWATHNVSAPQSDSAPHTNTAQHTNTAPHSNAALKATPGAGAGAGGDVGRGGSHSGKLLKKAKDRLKAGAVALHPAQLLLGPLMSKEFSYYDETRPVLAGSGLGSRITKSLTTTARTALKATVNKLAKAITFKKHEPLPRTDQKQTESDTHLRLGWDHSTYKTLARLARRRPESFRWLSFFGTQSIPESLIDTLEKIPEPLESATFAQLGADIGAFAKYLNPGEYDSVTEWAASTQDYQANALRRQIEMLRRLKYRPTSGFIFSAFADCRPCISFAIYDHLRKPKAAVNAIRQACAPVIVVADLLDEELDIDMPLLLDVHVVNDRHLELTGLEVEAELVWNGGKHKWAWTGSVAADSVSRIGSINWITSKQPGAVSLKIVLSRGGAVLATNTYQSEIVERVAK